MNHNEDYDDGEGGTMVATAPATAGLAVTVSAEIDRQISTAKAYPRSVKRFVAKATELVTLNEGVAGSCIYNLPRGGKQIVGPSVRFAEMVASAYGNLRCGARVVDEGETMLTAQGVCHDLEANIAITFETQRRITKRNGQRYDDDMIAVTGNAANSIALRNAILRCIPKALWSSIYDAARKTAVGDAKTLTSRRDGMLAKFGQLGVTKEQVFALLEKPGIDDITLDDLEKMIGVFTAIKDGKAIEEYFEPPQGEAKQKAADAIKAALPKTAPEAPKAPPAEPVDWFARIKAASTTPEFDQIFADVARAGLEESYRADVLEALEERKNEVKDGAKKRK